MDVRSTVGAVLRLPFDEDKLVDIICGTESSAANSSINEDHTTFWLVIADQFAKRGVACDRVRSKALDIIDTGADIAMLEKLGMKSADLRKRQRMLDELRARIVAAPTTSKPRRVPRKPQELVMEVGDVMLYPTCFGENINPYFASKELERVTMKAGSIPWTSVPWKQDGWGAMVILDCGRAFDYLAWYRPARLAEARIDKPTLESLRGAMLWTGNDECRTPLDYCGRNSRGRSIESATSSSAKHKRQGTKGTN